MTIFTAAKSAESIGAYPFGLERRRAQMSVHAEWIADHERAESQMLAR